MKNSMDLFFIPTYFRYIIPIIFVLIISLFSSFNLYAEVFKWTDENGKLHFGDKPPENKVTDKVDIKNVNTIKKSAVDEKEGTYKRDFFVMPARKSTVPYRFTLASKLSGKSPGDRLKEFNAKKGKMTFYIHVSMPGVERFQEYKYRSRIIDAKGELVFDKTVSYTPTAGSMFMVNNYDIKPTTDEPGKWTFQGILDGKKLFVEKRNIKFETPKKEKKSSTRTHPTTAGLVSVAPPMSDHLTQLPNGMVIKRPTTEKEMEALRQRIKNGDFIKGKRGSGVSADLAKTLEKSLDEKAEVKKVCSNQKSVGCVKSPSVIVDYALTDSNHNNSSLSTQSEVFSSPTAATMYRECNSENLKPGTSRSSLCDLWDEHLEYLQSRMDKECKNAGEKIYKTATNVSGIYLNHPQYDPDNPKKRFKSNILHSLRPSSPLSGYSSPAHARLYRAHEVYSKRDKGYVTQTIKSITKGSRVANIKKEKTVNTEPQSRFEVSYEHLTSKEDRAQGFYGDRTWIKDRKTDELMAERIIYFYLTNQSVKMEDGTSLRPVGKHLNYSKERHYYPCENYVPRLTQFEEKHPQNEYEFVSRVLKPAPFTQEENNAMYDFSIGNGKKRKDCVGMQTVGPGINPDNLIVERKEDDLKLAVKNKLSTFTCTRFFIGPHWDLKLLFTDGGLWQEEKVLAHGKIDWNKED